jgi:opacity protein-like surface antigen
MKARTLLAAVVAALLVPAVATAAPAKPAARPAARSSSGGSQLQGLSIGGFVGFETDDLSGLSLRVDGELPLTALAPQVNLSGVGSIGYSRLTDDLGFGLNATANILKFIPAARFTFPLNPQFSLFGDAGLGLYYASTTVEFVNPITGGKASVDDSEFSLMMRIGGGAWYQVNEQTRIGAMVEFNPYFGDFDQNTFLIEVGAMFRL